MHALSLRSLLRRSLVAAALFGVAAPAVRGEEVPGYGFPAAAQEVTQLFWLAETAAVCGWASPAEAVDFKLFTLRFLTAHLSAAQGSALRSMVSADGYEDKVRRAALEGARDNCGSNRWHLGWITFKSAADEHAGNF
jgi:hypothetical protein